ncbi:hypothetical protein L6452_38472 [Arctium lappa]|uniref:Uncharacterized protein n=1 Tax=Arctium lappa TaxID=4217 RepID=A0ACB8XQ62_ARCLA|nr:hypothetical protein L6452_38472 [Arctium lappa]
MAIEIVSISIIKRGDFAKLRSLEGHTRSTSAFSCRRIPLVSPDSSRDFTSAPLHARHRPSPVAGFLSSPSSSSSGAYDLPNPYLFLCRKELDVNSFKRWGA